MESPSDIQVPVSLPCLSYMLEDLNFLMNMMKIIEIRCL
ncbi:hypothetical protein JMJ77_0015358 [Colletotrichum scovillei]|uniref:Uncharacterized protein n=1 Tax=Colletotrichum scovillei TaxID=1209932 RepID=A0A9P7R0E1_9PEZI|nr:hypothetical protein JMJ77_0015358 [Colletotrichum scovillei]KAG7057008.1 hypothetical protein JMJ78_0000794 [Colletotrichum scovillei]KAG7066914.1 hypothetical protein JMJ76_0000761 [Colletotrichum scovillei]